MSLQTWKDEFYPTPATDDKSIAVAHSLQKWKGLTLENLRKHKVIYMRNVNALVNEIDAKEYANATYSVYMKCEYLSITSDSCSLCKAYKDKCDSCPLGKSENTSTFGTNACDDKDSPYFAFLDRQDPKPMIEILTKLL